MSEVSLDELVALFADPDRAPADAGPFERIETHISLVLRGRDRVYKFKKPVCFPFLDYSSVDRRLGACEDEVRLNRRLAPDIYLGLVAIRREPDGGLIFDAAPDASSSDGVVEWGVAMRRLPEDRMLDGLLASGLGEEDLDPILDRLAAFYQGAVRGAELDRFAAPPAIEANVRENLETLAPIDHGLPLELFARVRSSQLEFVKLRAACFEKRIAEGRICDGHGDLRPEHVCLIDPPVVYDCVEFSQAFRATDPLGELAFLCMECDFLGARDVGLLCADGYRRRSGDDGPVELFRFYEAYRATIRAKVEVLRADQSPPAERDFHLKRSRRYLHLAAFYALDFHRPRVVVVSGASGTGKTTVARHVARAIGAEVVSTDVVRREIAEEAPRYSDEQRERVYREQLARGRDWLEHSVSVVLDGTFPTRASRDRVRELARDLGVPIRILCCHCDPDVARKRIEERLERGGDASEARPELHERQITGYEPEPPGSPDVLDVLTESEVEALEPEILEALRTSG